MWEAIKLIGNIILGVVAMILLIGVLVAMAANKYRNEKTLTNDRENIINN